MTQPRGWWFESGGEQCDLKEMVIIEHGFCFLYTNVLTTTVAYYNFIFLHVNYKNKIQG